MLLIGTDDSRQHRRARARAVRVPTGRSRSCRCPVTSTSARSREDQQPVPGGPEEAGRRRREPDRREGRPLRRGQDVGVRPRSRTPSAASTVCLTAPARATRISGIDLPAGRQTLAGDAGSRVPACSATDCTSATWTGPRGTGRSSPVSAAKITKDNAVASRPRGRQVDPGGRGLGRAGVRQAVPGSGQASAVARCRRGRAASPLGDRFRVRGRLRPAKPFVDEPVRRQGIDGGRLRASDRSR